MLQLLIHIFTYGFDLFILLKFIQNILKNRRENIPVVFFYGTGILMEIILFINEYLMVYVPDRPAKYITNIVSFLTTFLLTLFFSSSLISKIFTALSFQLLVVVGEYIFTMLMYLVQPEIFQHVTPALNTPMNLGSKVILFFLTLIVSMIFGKSFRDIHKGYQLLIFTTPAASIIIMLFTPLVNIVNGNDHAFYLSIYICLSALNVVNYILLNYTHHQTAELFRLRHMEQLADYQQEKYMQLSSAYKSNRSLIHDTKKHYFIIEKYLENKEYDKLAAYLEIAMNDLENTYAEINTGNLVIDSFISSYKNICHENQIAFYEELSVDPNRIPINNYDLCIVLGNLLDNAVNACRQNTCEKNQIKLIITSNSNDLFYIHIQNTYNHSISQKRPFTDDDFSVPSEHGYGLKNIEKIADENHAVCNITQGEFFAVDLVFPVIDERQRIMIKR